MFNIVLYQPEIPQNTGNIGRLCVGTECTLHLIEPLGFSLDDKYMKRAGLDYWKHLEFKIHSNFDSFVSSENPEQIKMFTKKVDNLHWNAEYRKGDYLLFGRETTGLPDEIIDRFKDSAYRILMTGKTRSLNLSNSVAIVLYEGLRQLQ